MYEALSFSSSIFQTVEPLEPNGDEENENESLIPKSKAVTKEINLNNVSEMLDEKVTLVDKQPNVRSQCVHKYEHGFFICTRTNQLTPTLVFCSKRQMTKPKINLSR